MTNGQMKFDAVWLCDLCLRIVGVLVRVRPPAAFTCPECRSPMRRLHCVRVAVKA
jgi:hypothetical protein